MGRSLLPLALAVLLLGCGDDVGQGPVGPRVPSLEERLERVAELEALGLDAIAAEAWGALGDEVPEASARELAALVRGAPGLARTRLAGLERPLTANEKRAALALALADLDFDEAARLRAELRSEGAEVEDSAWLDAVSAAGGALAHDFRNDLGPAWTISDPTRLARGDGNLRAAIDFDGAGSCTRGVSVGAGALRLRIAFEDLYVGADGRGAVFVGLGRDGAPVLGVELATTSNQQRVALTVVAGEGADRQRRSSIAADRVFPRGRISADLCVVPRAGGATLLWAISGDRERWRGRLELPSAPAGELQLGVLAGRAHPEVELELILDALSLSGAAVEEAPERELTPEQRGNLEAVNGHDLAAEAAYNQGLEAEPFDHGLYRLRGRTRMRLKDYDGAARDLAIYAAREDRPLGPLRALLDALEAERAFVDLLEIQRQLEEGFFAALIEPDRLRRARTGLVDQLDAGVFEGAEAEARALLALGDADEAIAILDRALEQATDDARANLLLLRGRARLRRAETLRGAAQQRAERDRAKTDFSDSDALVNRPESLLLLAQAHLRNQEQAAAIATLDRALERQNSLPQAHNLRGLARNQKATVFAAINDFQAAIELDKSNGSYYYDLGTAWSIANQQEYAREAYENALRLGCVKAAKELE